MRFKKQCPSVDQLHEWFSCDYSTGILYWKNPRGPRTKIGDRVYCSPKNGYLSVSFQVNKRRHSFLAHRLIWKMYYREDLGQKELDHIDGDKSNNAINNLRLATPTENQWNRPYSKGFKRSNYHKGNPCSTGGWEAKVGMNGKQSHIGTFPCPLLARLAYIDAKRTLAKQFSPV